MIGSIEDAVELGKAYAALSVSAKKRLDTFVSIKNGNYDYIYTGKTEDECIRHLVDITSWDALEEIRRWIDDYLPTGEEMIQLRKAAEDEQKRRRDSLKKRYEPREGE